MHPEIEKFWNIAGYEIERICPVTDKVDNSTTWRYLFYLKKDGSYKDLAGVSKILFGPDFDNKKCLIYLYDGKEFSEEEMLNIVKFKAFL